MRGAVRDLYILHMLTLLQRVCILRVTSLSLIHYLRQHSIYLLLLSDLRRQVFDQFVLVVVDIAQFIVEEAEDLADLVKVNAVEHPDEGAQPLNQKDQVQNDNQKEDDELEGLLVV